jgi:hypothetical protein
MWNKKKDKNEVPFLLPKIEVGQTYIDKKWEDTIIKILAISKDGTEFRYEFLQVEGKPIHPPRWSHTTVIQTLELLYMKCFTSKS